ncbi:MAG: TonB-dependent receptor [Blastocatellia bacterium]|nr:TonB-dependent receptor [Blastocatellia bacterium]
MNQFETQSSQPPRNCPWFPLPVLLVLVLFGSLAGVQAQATRTIAGILVNPQQEPIAQATVTVRTAQAEQQTTTDEKGRFYCQLPAEKATLIIEGKNLIRQERTFAPDEKTDALTIEVEPLISPVHDTIVIRGDTTEPTINRQDDTLYKQGFAARDDQLFFQFGSGINAGQHEGGGKSLEIRRFGFNLDHGGVGPGLLVRVDNFDQNQATQGHGQGYLGQLKSLSSELVESVQVLNGPFSAQYGNFSGLGVVQVSLKESLADTAFIRLQGGSFNTKRGFFAVSPKNGFLAYELARTDTPFHKPYERDNLTGSYKFDFQNNKSLAFKFNVGRNDFFSAGQIPTDLIASRQIARFGAIDGTEGGRVRTFNGSALFKKEFQDGASLKFDGLVARSLFDLYNNFTFFLENEQLGDQFNQHDSRLQQSANLQYLKPYKIGSHDALLTTGGGFLANQIFVTLNKSFKRDPYLNVTNVRAKIATFSEYVQNHFHFGRVHLDAGLRLDTFYFGVNDRNEPQFNSSTTATKAQPKFAIEYHPVERIPLGLYFNYGRGVTSQDARGVAQRPEGPKVATTDFYQTGFAYNKERFGLSATAFLIDQSQTQVYITDDNTIEFQGPSRSYGYEIKGSARLNRFLSFNASGTKVSNAFFKGTAPREYLSNAPSFTFNSNLILSGLGGFSGVVSYRHSNSYILDSVKTVVRASGLDVVDFKLAHKLSNRLELSMNIDNLLNKKFYEVQNFGESRVRSGAAAVERIHGTPGYPVAVTFGVTFRFGEK